MCEHHFFPLSCLLVVEVFIINFVTLQLLDYLLDIGVQEDDLTVLQKGNVCKTITH